MIDTPSPPVFRLHFEGTGACVRKVPAAILAQAAQSLQRSVHLLALAIEGRDVRERLRGPLARERRYAVVFERPGEGGYDIPYVTGSAARKPFDPEAIQETTTLHVRAMEVFQDGDPKQPVDNVASCVKESLDIRPSGETALAGQESCLQADRECFSETATVSGRSTLRILRELYPLRR
jgi:hypothetical protein